jgi:hypothetical protein
MKKIAFLAVCLFAGSVNATVIDFESTTTLGCQVTAGGTVDGFSLGSYNGNSGAGFNNSCFGIESANSGTKYMLNYNSAIGVFTKDVGVFDLNSLYVRAWTGFNSSLLFLGLDGVNGNILYSMNVNVTNVWQKISFINWTGVKTFTWDPTNPTVSNIAIDDFEYNASSTPVSEPVSLALLGLGLAGIGFSRRKKAA